MRVTLRSGRNLQPATIEGVSASGRRLLVSAPGSNIRRTYSLRKDGSYRLEGSPDGAVPYIEIS